MMTHDEIRTILDEIYQQEVCIHQIPGVTLFEIGDEAIIYDKHRGFIFSEYNFSRKINSIDDCNKARVELRRYTERRELLERTLVGECEYQTERSFEHIEYVGRYIFGNRRRTELYVSFDLRNKNFNPVDDWYGFFRMLDKNIPEYAWHIWVKTHNQYKILVQTGSRNSIFYKNKNLTYEKLK